MTLEPLTIGRVETFALLVPQERYIASAVGRHDGLGVVGVRVHTEQGEDGVGWTSLIGSHGAASVRSFIDDVYAPLVVGQDAFDVRKLWTRMFQRSITRGRKGVPLYALSAVDIALWDAVTRAAGLPIHRYLGAVRDEVAVYGDGCWPSLSLPELLEEAQGYVELGLKGVKVKIGLDTSPAGVAEDLRRLDAVREVIGDDVALLVDANQAYDPLTAERVAHLLAERDVRWFEEPVLSDSISDQARIAERSPVPIAAGENEYSRFGYRDLIEAGGAHILQPDVHRVGGITELVRIFALADAHNLPVAPHTAYELHAQLLVTSTAGSDLSMVEYYRWFPEDVFTEDFGVRGGVLRPSQQPGVGARFTDEALRRFAV